MNVTGLGITLRAVGVVSLACLISADAGPSTAPIVSSRLGPPIQLFNGKDLTGWVWYQRPPKPGTTQPSAAVPIERVWSVRDGVLRTSGKPTGYIRTERAFPENYELTVEQRHVAKGNGGILFAMTGPDKVWPRCLEVQAASGEQGDVRNIAEFDLKMDASRVEPKRLRRTGPDPEKPVGEWETLRVVVDHGAVSVTVNGSLQNTFTANEGLAGRIGLQAEGGELEYRRVELTTIGRPRNAE
jgi:hypothetical protein